MSILEPIPSDVMLSTDERAARTHHERIVERPGRHREAKTIGKLLTSVHDSTAISGSALRGWSSWSTPRKRAMMAGQIIDRAPRTRTSVMAANVCWTSGLWTVIIRSSFVSSLLTNVSVII